MKKIFLFLIIGFIFIVSTNLAHSRKLPGVWTSSTGTSSQDGKATTISESSSQVRVRCDAGSECCWEIQDDGSLDIYDVITQSPEPPKNVYPPTPNINTVLTNSVNN